MGIVEEIEGADHHRTLHVLVSVRTGTVGTQGIAETVASITAQAQAQARDGVVVDAERTGIGIGDLEFVGASGTAADPTVVAEPVGIQSRQEHHLVTPVTGTSPEADARFVPCAGQDRILALGTVDPEELGGHVVLVSPADGHDHMPQAQVEGRAEAFLEPELFEGDLAAAFDLRLILAALLEFGFEGALRAAVLEFDLGAHRPAAPEIVAQVDDHVREVEATVAFVILVLVRTDITQVVVAEEIARHDGLAVPAYGQP